MNFNNKKVIDNLSDNLKVFTIAQESNYLIIYNIHAINLISELIKLISLYAKINYYNNLFDFPNEDEFCEAILVKFSNIQDSRLVKQKLNGHQFYAKPLKCAYAPQYELEDDLENKIELRKSLVNKFND